MLQRFIRWRAHHARRSLEGGAALASGVFLLVAAFARPAAALDVVVTIKPIHSLVAAVMGETGTPKLLVEGTASPHTYALRPSDAKALHGADVFFRVSEGLEPFTAKVVRALVQAETERQKLPSTFNRPVAERVSAELAKRGGGQKFSTYQSVTLPAAALKWGGTDRVAMPTVAGRRTVPVHVDPTRGDLRPPLEGKPAIHVVLPLFGRFCEDTVLVAHNAAFDMRFLELKEAATGIRFDQPVLDTLLLSAVVHPNLEDHRLEAIAERLGIRVIGRHTALGDALLTGEILLKLIPLLAQSGIVTLKQAREASRRTYHARLRY